MNTKKVIQDLNEMLNLVFEGTYLKLNPLETINSAYYSNWGIEISQDDFIKLFVEIEKKTNVHKDIKPEVWSTLLDVARSVVPFSMKEVAWSKLARSAAELTLRFYEKHGRVNILVIYAGFADYNHGKGFLIDELKNAIYTAILENAHSVFSEVASSLHFTVVDKSREALKVAERQITSTFPSSKVELINHFDLVALKRLIKDKGRMGYYHIVINTSLFGKHPFSSEFYRAISLLTRKDGYFISANGHHALWSHPFIFRELVKRLKGANLEVFDDFIMANYNTDPATIDISSLFENHMERLQTELVIEYYVRLNDAFEKLSMKLGEKTTPPDTIFDSTTTLSVKIRQLSESFFRNRPVAVVTPKFRGINVDFIYAVESRKIKE